MSGLISAFARLGLQSPKQLIRNFSGTPSIWFRVSGCLLAEPLKKKKRIDPQVVKAREDRRRKKLEKQIRRLERNTRQLKPIDELEVPLKLIDERKQRLRPISLTVAELERRVVLEKSWAKYKHDQHLADVQMFDRLVNAQQKALDELRKESEDLYQEAVQIDTTLIPYLTRGPVQTPPIKDYNSPDGDYNDISRKWE